jgi:hypothetical protein
MASYSRVTNHLLSSTPYADLPQWLPHIPLSARKAILTLCRVGSPYWKETSSRAWSRLHSELQSRVINPQNHQSINLADLISDFPFESSVFSGLLSSLIRSAPLNPLEAANAKMEAFEKESTSAMTILHPKCFRWDAILSHNPNIRSTVPFHHTLSHRPQLHHEIYARLSGAIKYMKTKILIPDYSRKTIGKRIYKIGEENLIYV